MSVVRNGFKIADTYFGVERIKLQRVASRKLVLCRAAAVKSLPVHHHSAGYILFHLGSLSLS